MARGEVRTVKVQQIERLASWPRILCDIALLRQSPDIHPGNRNTRGRSGTGSRRVVPATVKSTGTGAEGLDAMAHCARLTPLLPYVKDYRFAGAARRDLESWLGTVLMKISVGEDQRWAGVVSSAHAMSLLRRTGQGSTRVGCVVTDLGEGSYRWPGRWLSRGQRDPTEPYLTGAGVTQRNGKPNERLGRTPSTAPGCLYWEPR